MTDAQIAWGRAYRADPELTRARANLRRVVATMNAAGTSPRYMAAQERVQAASTAFNVAHPYPMTEVIA
jgi:hypothetical protein